MVINNNNIKKDLIIYKIIKTLYNHYYMQQKKIKSSMIFDFSKNTIIKEIDELWKNHLSSMENLRQMIHLRGYAQQDPKQEYKREGFQLFKILLYNINRNIVASFLNINYKITKQSSTYEDINYSNIHFKIYNNRYNLIKHIKNKVYKLPIININKIGRNELCICGSNKKFKQCHGKI